MTSPLTKKVDFAIKLLRSIPQDGDIEVSYSGGKDSEVILELAKMAGIPYRAIYKNTSIDPPGTISLAKLREVLEGIASEHIVMTTDAIINRIKQELK